jgi:hypothetical protein
VDALFFALQRPVRQQPPEPCRDPNNPKLPVYTHIGHTGEAPCGDYSKNLGERGKYQVRIVARDPVFESLPDLFETTEAHVGRIAYVPRGWMRVAAKGPKGLTDNQCIRVAQRDPAMPVARG